MPVAKFDSKDGRLRGRALQTRRLKMWTKASGLCARCGRLTDYPMGFELDHRTALHLGGTDEESNLQILCRADHAVKTVTERNDIHGASMPDWLEEHPRCTIVFGPPGSGKSSYVQKKANPYDVVLDLDAILSELSGLPLFHAGKEWLGKAIYLRNQRLMQSSRDRTPCWLIVSGVGKREQEWWTTIIKPKEIILLDVDAETCIDRIRADNRRPKEAKYRQVQAVRDWWSAYRLDARPSKSKECTEEGWPA